MPTSQDNNNAGNNQDWPLSVEEAVDRILAGMPEEHKQTVRSMPKADLIMFHHGWGTGIRNGFGLWGGNEALMKSCAEAQGNETGSAFIDPDDASGVIIEAVWQRLQDEGDI